MKHTGMQLDTNQVLSAIEKYSAALDEHMEGYEKMLDYYKEVVSNRLKLFMEKMDEKIIYQF